MSPRLELPPELLAPIGDDSPAGEEIRYDPVYDQIKVARTAEEDLPQGDWKHEVKQADFATVLKLAEEALATRSKDLQVAAWLTEALTHIHGFAGLTAGVNLVRELLERFWETAYPELEDDDVEFRATPLEWMAGYLEPTVKSVALNARGHTLFDYQQSRVVGYEADVADDYEKAEARNASIAEGKLSAEGFDEGFTATPKQFYKDLVTDMKEAVDEVNALEAFCDERLGEFAPSFRPLRESVLEVQRQGEKLLQKKLEIDPDPPEEERIDDDLMGSEGDSPGAASAGQSSAMAGGAARAATPRSLAEAGEWVATAARYLRKSAPTDPSSYLMLRGLRWGELRAKSTGVDPRLLEAPPTKVRIRLKSLLLDSRWPQLLETAEEVMATPFGRGWLDLQRYVLTACEGLGEDYAAVATAVGSALHSLLNDVPDLPMMTLMDDSPTANRETLGWLMGLGLMDGAGEDSGPAFSVSSPGRTASASAAVVERARARVKAGKPNEGVQLLLNAAEQARSTRERFLRKSDAAAIMVEQGMAAVALPILQELVELVDTHGLEDWEEGDVPAQALALLYRSLLATGEDEFAAQELYLRVCRLDPMEGMKLAGGGGSGSSDASYEEPDTAYEPEYDSGTYDDTPDEF